LLIADSGNSRVSLGLQSRVLFTYGGAGTELGKFTSPNNCSASKRAMYVADSGNNRVVSFDLARWIESSRAAPLVPRFSISSELGLSNPAAVAAVLNMLQEQFFVADRGNGRVILVTIPADDPAAVWNAMKQRLAVADVDGAAPFFAAGARDKYRLMLRAMDPDTLAASFSSLPDIVPVFVYSTDAEYRFDQIVEGLTISFPVHFYKENGLWKITEF
jgi:hypothetical protein